MKTGRLGVGLIGLLLFAFGCAAEVGAGEEQSTLTIDDARISRNGEHLLVRGTSHGQLISRVTDSVVVQNDSGVSLPWQEDADALRAGLSCYSCTSEDNGVHLNCVRVPCPDPS